MINSSRHDGPPRLAVIQTHPIQYHAPLWRRLEQTHRIPTTVIYGSDLSVRGYRDIDFGCSVSWDTDLLAGYTSKFLSSRENSSDQDLLTLSSQGLRQALEEAKPDAVLITGYSPAFHRSAYREARSIGCPLLFRAETTDHTHKNPWLPDIVRDTALRLFYRSFSKLLYIGSYSEQHYRRLGCTGDKLVFAPYCVNESAFECGEQHRERLRGATRGELGLNPDEMVVLFSGKLIPRKAPLLLLDALERAAEASGNRLNLIVLGDGPDRAAVAERARAARFSRIHLVGFQNQTQLSRFYQAADMFVLPSYSETWGLVVNEALHHGLPSVVSDGVGCAPDLIQAGNTGEIFQRGSAESLSEAILKTLPLLATDHVRRRCRERVARYSADAAAAGIAAAFHDVVIREKVA